MNSNSSVAHLLSSARRLQSFAEINYYESIAQIRDVEQNVPSRFTFSEQICDLDRQIQLFAKDLIVDRSEQLMVHSVANQMRAILSIRNYSVKMGALVNHLENIAQIAHRYLPFQLPATSSSSPLHAEEIQLMSSSSPIPIEEDIDEDPFSDHSIVQNVLDASFEDYQGPADSGNRETYIFRTQHDRVQVVDQLMIKLAHTSQVWKGALDSLDAALFDIFPAVLEGHLIQLTSLSYEEYFADHEVPPLTKNEFDQVKSLTFSQLADGMALQFDPQAPLPPIAVKLKSFGKAEVRDNEQLVSLGLNRSEQIMRQIQRKEEILTLSDLEFRAALRDGMEAESTIFIEPALRLGIHRIPKDLLQEVTIWLAARGRSDLLKSILDQRENDITRKTFLNSISQAYIWKHEEAFDLALSNYPHNRSGAAKELLLHMCEDGVLPAVNYALSPGFPHGFTAATINEAFQLALNHEHFHCLGSFFDAQVYPFDQTLLEAFAGICSEYDLAKLKTFWRPEILSKIPNYQQLLKQAFTDLCIDEDFQLADFFIEPPILEFVTPEMMWELMEGVIQTEKFEWDEIEVLLARILATPFFEELPLGDVVMLAVDAAKSGNLDLVKLFLNSGRGDEITQFHFEEILRAAAITLNWGLIQELIDRPNYQNYSRDLLGFLLLESVKTGKIEDVEKVISKGVSQLDLVQALGLAVQNGDIQIITVLLRQNPGISTGMISQLLSACYHNGRCDLAELLLLNVPAALEMSAPFLKMTLDFAIQNRLLNVLSLPFQNLNLLQDEYFERGLFYTVSKNQLDVARQIAQMRPLLRLQPITLYHVLTLSASSNDIEKVLFLFQYFGTQITNQMAESAYDAANERGHFRLAAILWKRIWDVSVTQTS